MKKEMVRQSMDKLEKLIHVMCNGVVAKAYTTEEHSQISEALWNYIESYNQLQHHSGGYA